MLRKMMDGLKERMNMVILGLNIIFVGIIDPKLCIRSIEQGIREFDKKQENISK